MVDIIQVTQRYENEINPLSSLQESLTLLKAAPSKHSSFK